jgi:hypothetical protein
MANGQGDNMLLQVLDWTYDQAVNGFSGLDSAEDLAADYLSGDGALFDKANALIGMQCAKAGASGFLAGLGGAALLPLSIPANVTSVLFIQIRMIAAIAIMAGFSVKDDRVKTLVFLCLVGDAGMDVLKQAGISIGKNMTINVINAISAKTIDAINQLVGFTLLAKFGGQGVVNLDKAVPVVGGLIGGTLDAVSTHLVGSFARNTFIGAKAS